MGSLKFISTLVLSSVCLLSASQASVQKVSVSTYSRVISLNGNSWRIAVDSTNKGRQNGWYKSPPVSKSKQCGATRISHNYCSGIHLGIWTFCNGRFIVNTLRIAENLGRDPAADRLFCNLLAVGSKGLDKPITGLPENMDRLLVSIGYKK
jgi:hypothetical protein